jgi:hypothetical protein
MSLSERVAEVGPALRLPLVLDAAALAGDLRALPEGAWVRHFNTRVYEGDWSGVAFRAPGGDGGRLYPDLTGKLGFSDTPWLASCSAVRAAMGALRCEMAAVRFLRVGAGGRIREHRDYDLGFATGEVRIHVPVTTSPEVDFVVGGARLVMAPGEVWYADFDRPHSVANRGADARVHLVLDCRVNEWLEALFERALADGPSPASG